jgi:hypothetical protein
MKHPVQLQGFIAIDSNVTLRAYEVYKEIYGEQEALITGSCRGGFGVLELMAFLYARSFDKKEWNKRFHEALRSAETVDITYWRKKKVNKHHEI